MVVKQYIMYCTPFSMPSFLFGWCAIHRRLISPISTLWDWRHRRKWWMWSLWDDALALLRNRNGFVFLVYSTAKTTGSWLVFLRTRSASEILVWLWTSLSLCNQFWGGDCHCCSWLPTALFSLNEGSFFLTAPSLSSQKLLMFSNWDMHIKKLYSLGDRILGW